MMKMKNGYEVRGEVTAIFLKRKDGTVLETLIDTEDLPKVQIDSRWYARWSNEIKGFYVLGSNNKQKFYLHRWLFSNPDGLRIDHMNHNTLDNRKNANLRIVNNSDNMHNRSGQHARNTSGYRGVTWHKQNKRWTARICVNYKTTNLGTYATAEEANAAIEEYRKTVVPYLREVENNALYSGDRVE